MTEKRETQRPRIGDDVRLSEGELLRALSHETRVKALAILSERVASPVQIALDLKKDVGHVGYHCRVLLKHGLIELVDTKPVRGATEHFYRGVERAWFDEDCWSGFDPEVKRAISSYGVDLIVQDAAGALSDGTFDSRDSRHLSRTSMLLDPEGFDNVGRIMDRALDAVLAEQAASDERRRTSREKGIPTIAAMAAFEIPPRDRA